MIESLSVDIHIAARIKKGEDNMKKLWRTLGALILGMAFLTGCGDELTGVALNGQPIDSVEIAMESDGQRGQAENGERITLTLGTLGEDCYLRSVVNSYNALSERYYVEIVDYLPKHYDNVTHEAAEDRFRMDLATGKGTDIVCFGNLIADELGYAGMLTDLNTFLTPEEKQEKYLGNILECAQTGEALYEISPAFTLELIVGDGSKLGMENGWTLEEMLESFERNGRDGSALGKGQVRTVAYLVANSIEYYVDWNMGTADFCNEEFYRILEFGKAADRGEFIRPTRESVASGTHLASCEMLVNVADIQKFKWLFGDNMAVKGWPSSYGTGVAVNISASSMGISSNSQYPDGAWDFLDFYAGATWTEREVYAEGVLIKESFLFPGFPLNRQLFEEALEISMVQQYTDAGDPVALLWGESGIPNFYANTAEDVEKLYEVIALADRRSVTPRLAIIRIIEEEISGYNAGVLTAEQTAEKIQNRVQMYLNEQK